MNKPRYRTSRQKACHQCSKARLKCDVIPSGCSRCIRKGVQCTYPVSISTVGHAQQRSIQDEYELKTPSSAAYASPAITEQFTSPRSEAGVGARRPCADQHERHRYASGPGSVRYARQIFSNEGPFQSIRNADSRSEGWDYTQLELACPIDSDAIQNRWLNSFIPSAGQVPKSYPGNVHFFIRRILKSYAFIAIRGRGTPPFIHWTQTSVGGISGPLLTCLSLIRTCDRQFPGNQDVTLSILKREMDVLYEQRESFEQTALLAAFQSYLLYSLALYFAFDQSASTTTQLREAMMRLQTLAGLNSKEGIVCTAEQRNARPTWESWIISEARRRTLYVMYLLDSLLLTDDGLPTFLGTELAGLPAPSSKHLWDSQTRQDWTQRYNVSLAEWPGGHLRLDELWPVPIDFDDDQRADRTARIEQWLEQVDEYGIMLYSVTSGIHGC